MSTKTRSKSKSNRPEPTIETVETETVATVVRRSPGREREGDSWMKGSTVAWIGLALTLALNTGQIGFTYAYVLGRLDANQTSITIVEKQTVSALAQLKSDGQQADERQERDYRERIDSVKGTLTRIDTLISSALQLKTDVEVVKNQLTTMNETLRRLERLGESRERRVNGTK